MFVCYDKYFTQSICLEQRRWLVYRSTCQPPPSDWINATAVVCRSANGLHQRAARIQCGGLRGDDFGVVDQAAAVAIEHLLLDLVGGQRCLSAHTVSSGSVFVIVSSGSGLAFILFPFLFQNPPHGCIVDLEGPSNLSRCESWGQVSHLASTVSQTLHIQ